MSSTWGWGQSLKNSDAETSAQCEVWDTSLIPFGSIADQVAEDAAKYGVSAEQVLFMSEEPEDDNRTLIAFNLNNFIGDIRHRVF